MARPRPSIAAGARRDAQGRRVARVSADASDRATRSGPRSAAQGPAMRAEIRPVKTEAGINLSRANFESADQQEAAALARKLEAQMAIRRSSGVCIRTRTGRPRAGCILGDVPVGAGLEQAVALIHPFMPCRLHPRRTSIPSASRRHAAARVRADPRRRGQRQDPRAHHAHRLADPTGRRAPRRRSSRSPSPTRRRARCSTRVTAMLPINTRGMWVGTFHGLCNRMLRTHHREAGLPQAFQILDIAGPARARSSAWRRRTNVDEEQFPPRQLHVFINSQQGRGHARRTRCDDSDEFTRRMRRALRGLRRAVPARRRGRFRRAAAALLRAAVAKRNPARALPSSASATSWSTSSRTPTGCSTAGSSCSAGRESGASSRSATTTSRSTLSAAPTSATCGDFERDFAVEDVVIKLEQNYRSHGNILDAANALIANNRNRLGKNLWTAEGKGEPLRVYRGRPTTTRRACMVEEVKALARERHRGFRRSRCCTAPTRSRACSSMRCSRAASPIGCTADLRFFERQEIKHALAYLRLVAGARRRQRLPARRQFPGARHRRAHAGAVAGRRAQRGISLWHASAARTHAQRQSRARARGVHQADRRACARKCAGAAAARSRWRR